MCIAWCWQLPASFLGGWFRKRNAGRSICKSRYARCSSWVSQGGHHFFWTLRLRPTWYWALVCARSDVGTDWKEWELEGPMFLPQEHVAENCGATFFLQILNPGFINSSTWDFHGSECYFARCSIIKRDNKFLRRGYVLHTLRIEAVRIGSVEQEYDNGIMSSLEVQCLFAEIQLGHGWR